MEVYMINFCHRFSISGPSLVAGGILFRCFHVIILSFSKIYQFSARKRIWSF